MFREKVSQKTFKARAFSPDKHRRDKAEYYDY